MDWIEHYFMCDDCAKARGGVYPVGRTCTMQIGVCGYCKKKGKWLTPWCDFNWPKNKKADKEAKYLRD